MTTNGIKTTKSSPNMAMIRPKGKAGKIAATVLKNKGVEVPGSGGKKQKVKDQIPFLQH